MDDYGIEVKDFTKKKPQNPSADSKATADKTPEDVQKVADKLADVQIEEKK